MSSITCTVALFHFLNACALNIFLRVQYTEFFFMKHTQFSTKSILQIVAQSKILQPNYKSPKSQVL